MKSGSKAQYALYGLIMAVQHGRVMILTSFVVSSVNYNYFAKKILTLDLNPFIILF